MQRGNGKGTTRQIADTMLFVFASIICVVSPLTWGTGWIPPRRI